jgi:hypothetical protein
MQSSDVGNLSRYRDSERCGNAAVEGDGESLLFFLTAWNSIRVPRGNLLGEAIAMSQRLTADDLIGAWIDDDDDFITITATGETLGVAFRDARDDEVFEVTAVQFADGQLSFQIRVPSTGYELSYVSKHKSDMGSPVFYWQRLDGAKPYQAGLSTLRPVE